MTDSEPEEPSENGGPKEAAPKKKKFSGFFKKRGSKPKKAEEEERKSLQAEVQAEEEGNEIEVKVSVSDNDDSDDDDDDSPSKEEEEEEDPHKLLAELEIEDFELSGDEEEALENGKINWDLVNWDKRMKREEIFSRLYTPSKYEKIELQTVADEVGIKSKSNLIGLVQVGMGSKANEDLQKVLFGAHAIIVRRGTLTWNKNDMELLLMTDGFILKYKDINYFNPLAKKFETCHLWTDVEFCEESEESFIIQMKSGDRWEFYAAQDGDSVSQWLQALENVIVQHTVHNPACSEITEHLGWQYTLIHRAGYTCAVTGNLELLGNAQENANMLDNHNQFAPLHYALLQEPCNIEVITCLLDAGASPNLADSEGRCPMYFAEKNELEDVKQLLESRGGKKSKLTEAEKKGELFGKIAASTFNAERRREKERLIEENKAKEAAEKAASAQDQMSKNMQALVERGEKIEELDVKTKELEEGGKDFSDMAKQLKNKVKNKKVLGIF